MNKLNLGCGKSKYPGFINVDVEPSVEPDLVCDFVKGVIPFETGSCETVLLIHTIEHIPEKFHFDLLVEINRVLKPGGYFMCAYPEFKRCAQNYIDNKLGMRKFWKATIYGRQLYPSDTHVALMDTEDFTGLLNTIGFTKIQSKPEPSGEDHNTVVLCQKLGPPVTKEILLTKELSGQSM